MKIISLGRKEEPLFSAGLFDVCWYRIGKTNKSFKLKTNSDFTHLFPDVPVCCRKLFNATCVEMCWKRTGLSLGRRLESVHRAVTGIALGKSIGRAETRERQRYLR